MDTGCVTVIDYGLGNLYSVKRAFEHVGARVIISDNPAEISDAQRLVLPGVGAFARGMENLEKKGLIEAVGLFKSSGRPFLGICLGMQLLMSQSEEMGLHQGLNFIQGEVVQMRTEVINGVCYKIPHVGWSMLEPSDKMTQWNEPLLEGLKMNDFVYFAHSYMVIPSSNKNTIVQTAYGQYSFCSIVKQDNVYGCQFHPEKSAEIGLIFLRNFINLS